MGGFFELLNAFLMFTPSALLVTISLRVRRDSRTLSRLGWLLASFASSHGVYHLLEFLEIELVAGLYLSPLNSILLLATALYYWRAKA